MKRSVLIVVSSDPCKTGRPAEAVRIAAGLSTHERLAVTLCLRGPAVIAVGENLEELVDGDHFIDYLPSLADSGTITIAGNTNEAASNSSNRVTFKRISEGELSQLVANSDRVLWF